MPWGSPEETGHAHLLLRGEKLIHKDEIYGGILFIYRNKTEQILYV